MKWFCEYCLADRDVYEDIEISYSDIPILRLEENEKISVYYPLVGKKIKRCVVCRNKIY